MGGYSSNGYIWRWNIPEGLKFRASNNLLAHLDSIVTRWIDMRFGRLQKGDCFVSIIDSFTSEDWSKKSNFSKFGEDPKKARISSQRLQPIVFLTTRTKLLMLCQETMTEQMKN